MVGCDEEEDHRRYMRVALEQAQFALERLEIPIGCAFVRNNKVIATGSNRTNEERNGTRHAELDAIDSLLAHAVTTGTAVPFRECDVYVTCEPCIMCAGALSLVGVRHVYYGCANDRFGGCDSILPIASMGCGVCSSDDSLGHTFGCTAGLYAAEAVELLQKFYFQGNPRAPIPHRPLRSDNAPLPVRRN